MVITMIPLFAVAFKIKLSFALFDENKQKIYNLRILNTRMSRELGKNAQRIYRVRIYTYLFMCIGG